jgi:hypothetical protein
MKGYLKVLGVVLLVGGLGICVVSVRWALGDEPFFRAARALERHPDHIIFQAEYQAALARHVAYIVTAVLSGLTGVIGSAVMFGLAAVLRRLPRGEIAAQG